MTDTAMLEAAWQYACNGKSERQRMMRALIAENERLRTLVEAHATVAALRVHACTAGVGQSVSPSGTVKSWHQPCPSCQRLIAARAILRASS